MNCIGSKIINKKLVIIGVQSILKNKRSLHLSYRLNHVFTYRSNRNTISNKSLRFSNLALVRLASTNVYEYNSPLGTDGLDSLKDISVNISQSSLHSTELSDLPSELAAKVVEPTFTSLGLGNFTPSGLLQLLLEKLHVSYDLPWWATVVVVTVALRVILVPLVIECKRHHAAYLAVAPELKQYHDRIHQQHASGNNYEAQLIQLQMQKFLEEKNIKYWKPMVPALTQGFCFLSFYYALSSMTALPIGSLKTGGVLWFSNLAVPDPYFLLPLISGSTVAFLFWRANDAFTPGLIEHPMVKGIFYTAPLVVVLCAAKFSSLIVLYWVTNNTFSIVQHFIFQSKSVQNYFNLPGKITTDEKNPPL